MSDILYLQVSPRGERSHSNAVAAAFLDAYTTANPGAKVRTENLFEMDLPPFDGHTIQGKYNIFHSKEYTPEEKAAWEKVEAVIELFASYDRYVISSPMWNFQIPYTLKHFLDVIVQPGYTFTMDENGQYKGLLENKKAFVALAKGGQYPAGTPFEAYDHETPYLTMILGFMGITDVGVVAAEGMLADPETRRTSKEQAALEARRLGESF